MRSKSKVKPYMRLTFNPEGKDHWLYKWVKPYLDLSVGIPDRSKSGKMLFMLNLENNINFAETREELVSKFGHNIKPKTYTFIAGNVYDNQALLKNNPDYIANLEALPRVEKERLLLGSWHAAMQGAGYFNRANVEVVSPKNVPRRLKTIRAYDLAVTTPSESYPNPDWTAGVKMSLCEDGYFYVENVIRFREPPHIVQERMLAAAANDGKNCKIGIPLDPGAQGKIAYQTWSQPLILSGYNVIKANTRKGKLERFLGFANAVENGLVRVVQGDWNDAWFYELEVFEGGSKTLKDDQVDATADAYNWLISGKKLPDKFRFNPASITKINEMLF
jgi:predicted phage terminase large subunit-like protein